MMTCVSTPGAPRSPITSITRPSAERRRGRPARDLDRHHVAGRRPAGLGLRHLHVHQNPAIERHDEAEARVVEVVSTDDALSTPLQDADDAPFGAIAIRRCSTRTTTRSPCMAWLVLPAM
jgi:hypothetical protein